MTNIKLLTPFFGAKTEYNFVETPFYPLKSDSEDPNKEIGRGYMCTRSTDHEVLDKRGLRTKYSAYLSPHFEFVSVWDDWPQGCGILPCPVYLRHCVLASRRDDVSVEAKESFMDEVREKARGAK